MSQYISETTCSTFFKAFCRLFRKHFQEKYIKPLRNDELRKSMDTYAMLGLPGCCGSIDATFVPWESCCHNLKNVCNGDKGQGLLYEVIVNHEKRVLSIEGKGI